MKVSEYLGASNQLDPRQVNGFDMDETGRGFQRGFSVKSTRNSVRRTFRKLSATLSAPQQNPNDPCSSNSSTTTLNVEPKRRSSFRQSKKKKHPADQWPPNFDALLPPSPKDKNIDGV